MIEYVPLWLWLIVRRGLISEPLEPRLILIEE